MVKISQQKILSFSALVLVASFALQCEKEKSSAQNLQVKKNDSLALVKKDSLIQDSIKKNTILYESFIFPKNNKDSALTVFNDKFSTKEQSAILALNRLDLKNKWRVDTLMIPNRIDTTLMSYSPFPRTLDQLKDVHKIVFFAYAIQAYALYEKGTLIKWGPTSMGHKNAQTKRGLMFANWKKELAISTVNSNWKLPYNFNVHNTLGIGWHQYDLPGYPASHSCLRLTADDAKFMYKWADQWVLNKGGATVKANGTPVMVFGDYNWGGQKPWKKLHENAQATDVSVEQMNDLIKPDISKILDAQAKRTAVDAEQNEV